MREKNTVGPSIDLWDSLLVTSLEMNLMLLITPSSSLAVQAVFSPPHCPIYLAHTSMGLHCSPLIPQASHLIVGETNL